MNEKFIDRGSSVLYYRFYLTESSIQSDLWTSRCSILTLYTTPACRHTVSITTWAAGVRRNGRRKELVVVLGTGEQLRSRSTGDWLSITTFRASTVEGGYKEDMCQQMHFVAVIHYSILKCCSTCSLSMIS